MTATPPTWPDELEKVRRALGNADDAAAKQDMTRLADEIELLYRAALRIKVEIERSTT